MVGARRRISKIDRFNIQWQCRFVHEKLYFYRYRILFESITTVEATGNWFNYIFDTLNGPRRNIFLSYMDGDLHSGINERILLDVFMFLYFFEGIRTGFRWFEFTRNFVKLVRKEALSRPGKKIYIVTLVAISTIRIVKILYFLSETTWAGITFFPPLVHNLVFFKSRTVARLF